MDAPALAQAQENAVFVQTAVNAFAALLAVAKLADAVPKGEAEEADLRHALNRLDTQHPDWRAWQP